MLIDEFGLPGYVGRPEPVVSEEILRDTSSLPTSVPDLRIWRMNMVQDRIAPRVAHGL